jgi:hypothetical protein
MFYFNTQTRVRCYTHLIRDNDLGLDHCFDCTSEICILSRYFIRYPSCVPLTWITTDNKTKRIGCLRDNQQHQDRRPGPSPLADQPNHCHQLLVDLIHRVLHMSRFINFFIGNGRTLIDPQPPVTHRQLQYRGHHLASILQQQQQRNH